MFFNLFKVVPSILRFYCMKYSVNISNHQIILFKTYLLDTSRRRPKISLSLLKFFYSSLWLCHPTLNSLSFRTYISISTSVNLFAIDHYFTPFKTLDSTAYFYLLVSSQG